MIIIQDAVISFIEKIKTAKRLYKLIAFFSVALVLMLVSVISSGVRVTYNVKCGDLLIANVSAKEIYDTALDTAQSAMADNAKIEGLELETVITVNKESATAAELSGLILKNASSVSSGYEVALGDKVVAYVENTEAFEKAKAERLGAFDVDGAECESKFADKVSVKPAFFHISKLTNDSEIKSVVNGWDVITVASTKTVYTVKYDTLTQKDSTKNAGVQVVLTKGVNGSAQTVEETTYVNGVAKGEPLISDVMLEYPIDEVLLIGTKNVYVSSTIQNASASGFRWPLAERGVITSYWGDGRNHGGIDIGVVQGTSVLAVKGGKVIAEGYRSDYGYFVTIDHGNGVQTKYAHNKSNTVSVGQTVSAGQVIALSGNTGRSTGPHLHFEVIINGDRVNPGYYLNLN
jgi:murein DD-endopeptidase MepM/ murein hydrolase activator NlpD